MQFLFLGLPLERLQVAHYRRAPHIEEVLAYPFVARPATVASPQMAKRCSTLTRGRNCARPTRVAARHAGYVQHGQGHGGCLR
jgi:hypothetical protein